MRSATYVYQFLLFMVISDGAIGTGPVLFVKQVCGHGAMGELCSYQKIQGAKYCPRSNCGLVRQYTTSAHGIYR